MDIPRAVFSTTAKSADSGSSFLEMRTRPTIQLSTIPTAVAGQHRHTCYRDTSQASRSSRTAGGPDSRPSGRVAHARQSRRRSCQANRGKSPSSRPADRRTLWATMYAPTPKQVTWRGGAGRITRLPQISAPPAGTSSLPAVRQLSPRSALTTSGFRRLA